MVEVEDPRRFTPAGLDGQQQPVGGPQPGEAQQHAGIEEKEDDPCRRGPGEPEQRVGQRVARAGLDVAGRTSEESRAMAASRAVQAVNR